MHFYWLIYDWKYDRAQGIHGSSGKWRDKKVIKVVTGIRRCGNDMNLERAYRRYIEDGSFSYILQINHDHEMVREYLLGLYNTIVLKDVVSRRKITDVMMLQSVVRFWRIISAISLLSSVSVIR